MNCIRAWSCCAVVLGGMSLLTCSWAAEPVTGPPKVGLPTDAIVREAVTRSLPFLEKEGTAWMADRGCMSCHHVPFLVWSHRAAATRGLEVDRKKLAEWDNWCRDDSLAHRNLYRLQKYELGQPAAATLSDAVKEKLQPLIEVPFKTEAEFVAKVSPLLTEEELKAHLPAILKTAERKPNAPDRTGGGLDVVGQLLLGSHGSDSPLARPEFRDGTLDLMRQNQLSDGSWIPGNQFATMRRWSASAANQATSMWTALALDSYGDAPEAPARREALQRWTEYLKSQPPVPDNHEWLAIRLLFASRFDSPEATAALRKQLLAARRENGGWGWEPSLDSDPLSTGLALYVLSKLSRDEDAQIIAAARGCLLHLQASDGSWPTAARNFTKSTDPERLKARNEIYHYWGTAWAAIGLLETLPTSGR